MGKDRGPMGAFEGYGEYDDDTSMTLASTSADQAGVDAAWLAAEIGELYNYRTRNGREQSNRMDRDHDRARDLIARLATPPAAAETVGAGVEASGFDGNLPRWIVDGWTGGNETWEETDEITQERAEMAARAVLAGMADYRDAMLPANPAGHARPGREEARKAIRELRLADSVCGRGDGRGDQRWDRALAAVIALEKSAILASPTDADAGE